MNNYNEKIIVALDFREFSQAKKLINELGDSVVFYKIGYEAYFNYGNKIIKFLKKKNKKIFLDLKFNDIPNTVLAGIKYVISKNINITTVHSTVSDKTIELINRNNNSDLLIAYVTVLTSFNNDSYMKTFNTKNNIENSIEYIVKNLVANNCKAVICSANEASKIKKISNNKLITICPGIRLNQDVGDQSRVMKPSQAFKNGADYIVVGREITSSNNPKLSFEKIMEDINENITK